jgi:hypothetical protein
MSTKLVPTFADRGRRVVSATDPYGINGLHGVISQKIVIFITTGVRT